MRIIDVTVAGWPLPSPHQIPWVFKLQSACNVIRKSRNTKFLSPVYMIQPVVNVCIHDTTGCQTRCQTGWRTRLTTGLTNGCIVYTAGCQTGWQPGCTTLFDNRLNKQWLFVQHGCQTGCQTCLTTGWMFVYTIQPVVKPVVQPVWQPAVSCKRGFSKDHVEVMMSLTALFVSDSPAGSSSTFTKKVNRRLTAILQTWPS